MLAGINRAVNHVDDIKFVVNFDYPNSSEDYVHRIGRTGRAKRSGTAYTFFTPGNIKQANELISILKEAKQQVNPKLIQMAENARGMAKGRSRWGGGSGGGGGGRGRGGSVRGRFTASAGPKSFSSYGSSSSAPSYGSSVNGSGAASYQRNSYSATGGTGSSSSYGSPYGQWQPVTSAGATGGKF